MSRRISAAQFVAVFLFLGFVSLKPAFADEQRAAELLAKAKTHIARSESAKAIKQLSDAIQADPKLSEAYYLRGREHFRLSQFTASLTDFDTYLRLQPDRRASLWERGITCYYAGAFRTGAKQFERYQTYHDNDVENATWRYLCLARDPQTGLKKARQTLLPITNDRRVPMMQIYAMYRGEMTPAEVLASAQADEPSKEILHQRLFYAHLYIGLFEEAAGKTASAKGHIQLAAQRYKIAHYMGDVARVHWERFQAASIQKK